MINGKDFDRVCERNRFGTHVGDCDSSASDAFNRNVYQIGICTVGLDLRVVINLED